MLDNKPDPLIEQREKLLKRCRDALILGHITSEINFTYDGYGDSGGVDNAESIPENIELENDLKEFMDRLAYQTNPGYEINEGGGGSITWDINSNKIYIQHYQNITIQEASEYEL